MKSVAGSWFLLGLVGTLQAEAPKPTPKFQVFVYNHARLSSETLARAEHVASRIFRRIGIETEWLECQLTPAEAAQHPVCLIPASQPWLVLRVLPRSTFERHGRSRKTVGFAWFPDDGGFGMYAHVCAHCFEDLAKGNTEMHSVILGHIMAHELGHLLLGKSSHGARGIMQFPWDNKAMESITQESLFFVPWEGEKMRQQLSARLRGQVSMEASKN